MMNSNDIDWNDVIKKEAIGINNEDFGEVQDVQGNYVRIQRGIVDKETYYIPKERVGSYDGNILNFRISESDLKTRYNLKTRYKDEPFMHAAESDTLESDMNVL